MTSTNLILHLYPKPSPKSLLLRPTPSPPNLHRTFRSSLSVKCQALGQQPEPTAVYQGVYGPWKVESSDVQEVVLYRSGLVAAASSFVIASSAAFLHGSGSELFEIIGRNLDLFYGVGACGLGLSLYLIHIYVTEIKRTLQALWLIGALGSLAAYAALAQPAGKSLVEYVVENPAAVWFVGPLFAALTGLVFKEGLCYGKLEAGILTFIIPSVLLGHLSGLMDEGTKVSLLGVWMALFVVFAGRKFTQPIKDDIGDKSVFIFNALPQEEKEALIKRLEAQDNRLDSD
ncbi:integral membrane family protein [Perilla frutescens var. frutescens]|nr:integral membrane family protein [Perilla frutescens var. frutescens]